MWRRDPPRAIADFDIDATQIVARIGAARIVAPSNAHVLMKTGEGRVGMVDRDRFDPWLRDRAEAQGAERLAATFVSSRTLSDGRLEITFTPRGSKASQTVVTRLLVGADGANSAVRREVFGPKSRPPYVFAYHEIVRSPARGSGFDPECCDVVYQGRVSPDFYGWVFPHGDTTSIGVGSAVKGFDFREATALLRRDAGLEACETIREEGAPLPLKPMRCWHHRSGVLLVGDAAGVVAPSSGEGIYYAMLSGKLAADACAKALATRDTRALAEARRVFMRDHAHLHDPRADAVLLVSQRQASGAVRRDLRGPRRPAADLGILPEQAAGTDRPACACAGVLQGPAPHASARFPALTLETFISGGTVALVAAGIILVECLVVAVAMARNRRAVLLQLANGAAGITLLSALYVALTDGGWEAIAVCLALAFVAHAADLVLRLRRN